MKSFLVIAFTVALMLICVSAHSQQNVILDSDSAKLFEGFGRYFVSPSVSEKTPVVGKILEGEAVFKIVKVTNIQGNNPFNPVQPVYNFGGVLVANTDDLIECVRGGKCSPTGGGGGIICSPSTGVSDVANFKDSVGCYVKGNGTICRVERLPSMADLKYETLYVMYDKTWAMSAVVGADDKVSDYKMIKPPSNSTIVWPGGNVVYKVSNGTYIAEVQHKATGIKYRINFTVTNLPGGDVRLTVNSLTRI